MAKDFDVDKAVADFRALTARIDDPTTPPATRAKLQAKAQRLREKWKKWNGDDELFELAYSYPEEDK